MEHEDLRTLSRIGSALWADEGRGKQVALETLTAVSMLRMDPTKTLERASSVLLDLALRDGVVANARSIHISFFRLSPRERFALAALHLGRWSYARLARVMGESPDAVAELAWKARVYLGTNGIYPAGSAQMGERCPEYESRRPWTQKFLDEELATRERLFIQNHLMGCESCRQTLNRCRDLYFNIDSQLNQALRIEDGETGLAELWERQPLSLLFRPASERSFVDSLRIFLRRWDVKLVLILAGVLIFVRLLPQFLG